MYEQLQWFIMMNIQEADIKLDVGGIAEGACSCPGPTMCYFGLPVATSNPNIPNWRSRMLSTPLSRVRFLVLPYLDSFTFFFRILLN